MRILLSRKTQTLRWSDRRELLAVLAEALRLTGLEAMEPAAARLQLVVMGERAMARLNEGFLGHAGSTDVVTFDLRGGPACPGEPATTGEIYVCAGVAARAAAEYGTTPSRELLLYMVHGMLHLAGLDDHRPRDIAAMRRAERRVMTALAKRFDLDRLFS